MKQKKSTTMIFQKIQEWCFPTYDSNDLYSLGNEKRLTYPKPQKDTQVKIFATSLVSAIQSDDNNNNKSSNTVFCEIRKFPHITRN